MTPPPFTFDPAQFQPLNHRGATAPIHIPRFDQEYDAQPGPLARIVPELSTDQLLAIAFSFHAPGAAALALQANGWWRTDVPHGADLLPRSDGWFTGVFGAPPRWRATFRFARHDGAGDPTWWTTGLKRRPVRPGVAWPGGRDPQRDALPSLNLSPQSYVIDLARPLPGAAIVTPAFQNLTEPLAELPMHAGEPRTRCWVPAGRLPARLPVVVFTDGETHLTRLNTPGHLARAVARGELPALLAVFVDSGPDRSTVLGVPGGQATWIPRTLIPRLRAHPKTRVRATRDAHATVIVGSSYGGLTALFALIQAPEVIGIALAQSVSLHRFERPRMLQALSCLATRPTQPIIRMHAGTYEGGESAQHFLTELERTCGLHVPFALHPGGHDWAWWLPIMLADLAEVLA